MKYDAHTYRTTLGPAYFPLTPPGLPSALVGGWPQVKPAMLFQVLQLKTHPVSLIVSQAQGAIWDRCHQQACLAALDALNGNKARWPEVVEEKQANDTACDECVDKDATTCEVIVADACNQRIGYVCWKDEAPRKTRTLQELVLERPEP